MFHKYYSFFIILSTYSVLSSEQIISTATAQAQLSLECTNHCVPGEMQYFANVTREWNITIDQISGNGSGVPAKSYCCANWQMNDYVSDLVKDFCNLTDISLMNKQRFALIKHLNLGRCASYSYKSGACPHDTPPNIEGPSQDCMNKSQDDINGCAAKIKKQWNITLAQLTGKDKKLPAKIYCCAYWEADDCAMDIFKKHCNKADVIMAQTSRDLDAEYLQIYSCGNFTYHSDACSHAKVGAGGGAAINTISKIFNLLVLLYFSFYLKMI